MHLGTQFFFAYKFCFQDKIIFKLTLVNFVKVYRFTPEIVLNETTKFLYNGGFTLFK